MDFSSNTEEESQEFNLTEGNNLLDIIKDACSDSNIKMSMKLRGKVNRIIAETDLQHHTSLHKVSAPDDSATSVLGFMKQSTSELTYDEQVELNQAIITKIERQLPTCIAELEKLKNSTENCKKYREEHIKEMKERDSKLDTLHEQECEKTKLMMEWLNHRIHGVTQFNESSSELFSLKTKILNMKSKILHLQMLQNIFTETNQSIKAYSEVHTDLKNTIKETEQRIKNCNDIIQSEYQ